jgi:hypothetical protein
MLTLKRAILSLSVGTSLVVGGCATTTQSYEVHELEPGMYTMGVPKSSGSYLLESGTQKALFDAVGKAGDYCHAKGQKLADSKVVKNSITFRCVPGQPTSQ